MKPAATRVGGGEPPSVKPRAARIQASCSEEEAALLRQVAEHWGIPPAAALRRLIREEAARQGRGGERRALAASNAAVSPPPRGQAWIATLGYQVPPIWDAMQSHLAVLTERLREQWPGFSEGGAHPAAERTHVCIEFTLPDGAASADLRAWLEDEWNQIARDAGSVEVEEAPVGSPRDANRAA